MPDIFFSYSRQNKEYVEQLRLSFNKLVDENIDDDEERDIWVDWEDIRQGENWWNSIQKGIRESNCFVFFISPHSMTSLVCNMELNFALKLEKRIIPLMLVQYDRDNVIEEATHFRLDEENRKRFGDIELVNVVKENMEQTNHINWVFFDTDNVANTRNTILEIYNTDLDYVASHTRYLTRANEWLDAKKPEDHLLFGSEIALAEEWLTQGERYAQHQAHDKISVVNPEPLDAHRQYIEASRQAQQKRQRIVQFASVAIAGLVVMVLIGIGAVIVASQQVNALNEEKTAIEQQIEERTAELNRQFSDIAPTIDEAEIGRAYCVVGILTEAVDRESVLILCERMVELASILDSGFYRDFRGIANAQAGNLVEARQDFDIARDYYRATTDNCDIVIDLRTEWIDALRDDENPFLTDGELEMSTAIQDWLNEPSIGEPQCPVKS